MLRLWAVVRAGNLVGTFLFALCLGKLGIFDAHTQQCLTEIDLAHIGADFGTVLIRAVFAG
jgi:formate-nitrite transporter family protein